MCSELIFQGLTQQLLLFVGVVKGHLCHDYSSVWSQDLFYITCQSICLYPVVIYYHRFLKGIVRRGIAVALKTELVSCHGWINVIDSRNCEFISWNCQKIWFGSSWWAVFQSCVIDMFCVVSHGYAYIQESPDTSFAQNWRVCCVVLVH